MGSRTLSRRAGSRGFTLLLGLASALLVGAIIVFPDRAFAASLGGLRLWWTFVFPALLPFLIVSELAFGFGLIHGAGRLMEPFMRLLLRVPGIGGWPLAATFAGGYPAAGDFVGKLRRQGLLRRGEAERLAAASHLCNPMTMIAVIGAGFLHSVKLGFIIATAHYLAAVLVMLLMRGHEAPEAEQSQTPAPLVESAPRASIGLLAQSLVDIRAARAADGRSFGKLLGDAVSSAIQKLMLIGGFIMLFAVIQALAELALPLALDTVSASFALPALLEPHLGAFAAARIPGAADMWRAAWIGALLGWSGLSLHAQVRGLLFGTDVRYAPFLRARLWHACLAFGITLIAWKPLAALASRLPVAPAPSRTTGASLPAGALPQWTADSGGMGGWPLAIAQFALLGGAALAALLLLSLLLRGLKQARR
ncbi:MAG: hypothetical protein J7639_18450 [Paenibacillaceae bacterium]|nr:hypothetical protein [Paenibacillaceae bacterium]